MLTSLFLDPVLGNRVLSEALREAGVPVEVYQDHFAPGIDDVLWLPVVVERDWVILTAGKKMVLDVRVDVIKRLGGKVFRLNTGSLTGKQIGATVIRSLDWIEHWVNTYSGPFIADIGPSGNVKMWQEFRLEGEGFDPKECMDPLATLPSLRELFHKRFDQEPEF